MGKVDRTEKIGRAGKIDRFGRVANAAGEKRGRRVGKNTVKGKGSNGRHEDRGQN